MTKTSRGNVYTRWHETRTATQEGAFLLEHLKPGMALLDVGCGPGTITLGFADAIKPGSVTGVDLDRPRIQAARARAEASGVANVTFQQADAHALPFPNGSFDAVFMNALLEHLSNA